MKRSFDTVKDELFDELIVCLEVYYDNPIQETSLKVGAILNTIGLVATANKAVRDISDEK